MAIAQQAVGEEDIDGEALFTLTEKDIQEVLQVTKFGPKRKLWARIKAFGQAASSAAAAASAATAAAPVLILGATDAPGGRALHQYDIQLNFSICEALHA